MLDLRMSADVLGRDGGKLGEVSRLLVDPIGNDITGIAVRRGVLVAAEYIVPLAQLSPASGDALAVDMDEGEFEQLDRFDLQAFREPDPDYTGPPGWDRRARGMDNLQLTSIWAMGPMAGLGAAAPVFGFPGGESSRPPSLHWASIHRGSDVLDSGGEKVGEIAEVSVDETSGEPSRVVVRRGWLFKSEMDVPANWICDIRDDAVVLDGRKDEIVHRLAS